MTLQDYLDSKKITKYRAAKEMGVAWTTIWRWITGRSIPEAAQMRTVQEWTGGAVTPNDWVPAKPAMITGKRA
jgi:hypothetical protein